MKSLIIFAVCMLFAANLQAQQVFNVQNGTKTAFYDDLETAIKQAVSGDTIYLPGAEVQVKDDLIIDKKLALIGAGCDVDSIGGLKRTEIKKKSDWDTSVNINFREGSNGSLLTGCVVGSVVFGHKNDVNDYFLDIENITIQRNNISSINLGLDNRTSNMVKKISIMENILSTIGGNYASECLISNNLLYSINYLNNSYIYNNVMTTSYTSLSAVFGCFIQNNYFWSSGISGDNNSFFNNAFEGNIIFPQGTNSGANNLVNQERIKTFQVNDLSSPKNLQIRDTSPCKNAGSDGTDIGLFGGSQPYKAGAVPFNPHINKSSIATQTDKDGNLKVNIQVSAQTR